MNDSECYPRYSLEAMEAREEGWKEIDRLRAENTRLKAELEELKAEVARLKKYEDYTIFIAKQPMPDEDHP